MENNITTLKDFEHSVYDLKESYKKVSVACKEVGNKFKDLFAKEKAKNSASNPMIPFKDFLHYFSSHISNQVFQSLDVYLINNVQKFLQMSVLFLSQYSLLKDKEIQIYKERKQLNKNYKEKQNQVKIANEQYNVALKEMQKQNKQTNSKTKLGDLMIYEALHFKKQKKIMERNVDNIREMENILSMHNISESQSIFEEIKESLHLISTSQQTLFDSIAKDLKGLNDRIRKEIAGSLKDVAIAAISDYQNLLCFNFGMNKRSQSMRRHSQNIIKDSEDDLESKHLFRSAMNSKKNNLYSKDSPSSLSKVKKFQERNSHSLERIFNQDDEGASRVLNDYELRRSQLSVKSPKIMYCAAESNRNQIGRFTENVQSSEQNNLRENYNSCSSSYKNFLKDNEINYLISNQRKNSLTRQAQREVIGQENKSQHQSQRIRNDHLQIQCEQYPPEQKRRQNYQLPSQYNEQEENIHGFMRSAYSQKDQDQMNECNQRRNCSRPPSNYQLANMLSHHNVHMAVEDIQNQNQGHNKAKTPNLIEERIPTSNSTTSKSSVCPSRIEKYWNTTINSSQQSGYTPQQQPCQKINIIASQKKAQDRQQQQQAQLMRKESFISCNLSDQVYQQSDSDNEQQILNDNFYSKYDQQKQGQSMSRVNHQKKGGSTILEYSKCSHLSNSYQNQHLD